MSKVKVSELSVFSVDGLHSGTLAVVTRGGRERFHQVSRASLDRLSRVVASLVYDEQVTVRPFRSGLGWVAEEA